MHCPTPPKKRRQRQVVIGGSILLLAAGLTLLAGYRYLTSPAGAARIASTLAGALHQPVRLDRLGLEGGELVLEGFRIGNPAGFPAGDLLAVKAIRLAPDWPALLTGRRALRLVRVDAPRLDLRRTPDGQWNFRQLQQQFRGGKGDGQEFRLALLRIDRGAILVDGRGIDDLNLSLRDFASNGSTVAGLHLELTDPAGSRWQAVGRFRSGPQAEAELDLAAPQLTIATAAAHGQGTFHLHAALREGHLRSELHAELHRGDVTLAKRRLPLVGTLTGRADYQLAQDRLVIEKLALNLADLLAGEVRGTIAQLKSGAQFDLHLALDRLQLARLAALLPNGADLAVTGGLSTAGIALQGSRRGLSGATGRLALRDFGVTRRGTRLVAGLTTDLALATKAGRLTASGELHQTSGSADPLLDRLHTAYSMELSEHLRPRAVELSDFTATLAGVPLSGRLLFQPAARESFRLALTVPRHPVEPVTAGDFRLTNGTVAATIDLRGSGRTDWQGNVDLLVTELAGRYRGEAANLAELRLATRIAGNRDKPVAAGEVSFAGAGFRGRSVAGSFGFTATDDRLQLANGKLRSGEIDLAFAEIVAAIPPLRKLPAYPVQVAVNAAGLTYRSGRVGNLTANVAGSYAGKAFTGAVTARAGELAWQDRPVGRSTIRLDITPEQSRASLGGELFGGALNGRVETTTAGKPSATTFDVSLQNAEAASLAGLFPNSAGPAAGRLTLAATGNYAGASGLSGTLSGRSDGIAIVDTNRKQLLADAGLNFTASLAQGRLLLPDARLRLGEGAEIQVKGSIDNALSPDRIGAISFGLAATPLAGVIDPLVNGLPRLLQEATFTGKLAAHALLTLQQRTARVNGFVRLAGAGLSADSHKLAVEGIDGEIPFIASLPLTRVGIAGPATVRRTNFADQLASFRAPPADGSLLRINRLGFGPLVVNDTSFRLKAAENTIDLADFAATLHNGALRGRGQLALAGGGFAGTILVSDLSLRQLCDLFPKIKGYVSGRVDGIVSIVGRGKGASPAGDLYLWTREGDGEKMLVSREFLQKLAGKNLQGFFFRDDRPFDKGEVKASLADGYLTFDILDISHTNLFGINDLKVSVTETQNRIALNHLLDSIRQAASRGKAATGDQTPAEPAAPPEFKWDD